MVPTDDTGSALRWTLPETNDGSQSILPEWPGRRMELVTTVEIRLVGKTGVDDGSESQRSAGGDVEHEPVASRPLQPPRNERRGIPIEKPLAFDDSQEALQF